MKTKLSLIVLAVICASLNIQAASINGTKANDSTKHRINIRVNQKNQVVLRADCFKGEKRLNYILKVYSENRDLIYASSFLKKGAIYKTYNLSNLPQGKYTFTILKKRNAIYSKEVVKSTKPNINLKNKPLLVEEL